MAGLPESINFHSLRHTFAAWAVMRGMDLYRLKEILGHADMKTTLVYAHLQPDALRRAMQRCFGDDYVDPQVELHMLRAQLAAKTEECERLKGELGRMNKQILTTTSSL
jgi:hypothetical protein